MNTTQMPYRVAVVPMDDLRDVVWMATMYVMATRNDTNAQQGSSLIFALDQVWNIVKNSQPKWVNPQLSAQAWPPVSPPEPTS